MKLTTLFSHSAQLNGFINKSGMPSDTIASNYFRSKKYIGSKERRFISETVFLTLRNKYLCTYCFEQAFPTIHLNKLNTEKLEFGAVLTAFYLAYNFKIDLNFDAEDLFNILPDKKENNLQVSLNSSLCEYFEITLKEAEDILRKIAEIFVNLNYDITALSPESELTPELLNQLSIRYSMDAWQIKELNRYITKDNLLDLLSSLTQSAHLILRLNTLNILRDDFIQYLNSLDKPAEKCSISPVGVRILKRVKLDSFDFFKEGIVEVQDEGSQLISYALAPTENTKILDACSGAGGKSLHIASLTNDNSEILAVDIDSRKLKELERRAGRFGYKSIKTKTVRVKDINNNVNLSLSKEKFDFVLVDAPCSGMGTVRRSPMNKYKLTEILLQRLKENQLRILNYYSKFVADGGVLVYSTCSLMTQENQEVVKEFLQVNSGFELTPLSESFEKYSIKIPGLKKDDYFINLLPSVHGTDGFFIAKMRKKIND